MILSKQFNIYSLKELKLLALLQCTGESLAFTITDGSMKEAVERMELNYLNFISIMLHAINKNKAELNCNCYTAPCAWCSLAHFLGPGDITYAFSEQLYCGKVEL